MSNTQQGEEVRWRTQAKPARGVATQPSAPPPWGGRSLGISAVELGFEAIEVLEGGSNARPVPTRCSYRSGASPSPHPHIRHIADRSGMDRPYEPEVAGSNAVAFRSHDIRRLSRLLARRGIAWVPRACTRSGVPAHDATCDSDRGGPAPPSDGQGHNGEHDREPRRENSPRSPRHDAGRDQHQGVHPPSVYGDRDAQI